MTNGTNLTQNEVAGFLLGLGIGLVVGFLFQPPLAGDTRGLLRDNSTRAGSQTNSSAINESKRDSPPVGAMAS
jgi:hypothetical protein